MLDNALDLGISEEDFWNMTIGGLDRLGSSKQRTKKDNAKEKAVYGYKLALLIGRAIRGGDEEHPFPELYEVYPELFLEEHLKQEEAKAEQQAKLSAIRFIQFAESFNAKFDKEANE